MLVPRALTRVGTHTEQQQKQPRTTERVTVTSVSTKLSVAGVLSAAVPHPQNGHPVRQVGGRQTTSKSVCANQSEEICCWGKTPGLHFIAKALGGRVTLAPKLRKTVTELLSAYCVLAIWHGFGQSHDGKWFTLFLIHVQAYVIRCALGRFISHYERDLGKIKI